MGASTGKSHLSHRGRWPWASVGSVAAVVVSVVALVYSCQSVSEARRMADIESERRQEELDDRRRAILVVEWGGGPLAGIPILVITNEGEATATNVSIQLESDDFVIEELDTTEIESAQAAQAGISTVAGDINYTLIWEGSRLPAILQWDDALGRHEERVLVGWGT